MGGGRGGRGGDAAPRRRLPAVHGHAAPVAAPVPTRNDAGRSLADADDVLGRSAADGGPHRRSGRIQRGAAGSLQVGAGSL